MAESTPTFQNPPIVEFVLGVQFNRLDGFSAGHFGKFWNELDDEWSNPEDRPPIPDHFEGFRDSSIQRARPQFRLEQSIPVGRMTLRNAENNRLLQLQPTRLHFNWRKTDDLKPSYKQLIGEFEEMLACFDNFCRNMDLGSISPNQWEVTYVDSFPKGEYWDTPDDWGKFLPGLFDLPAGETVDLLRLERRQLELSYEISEQLGRLHISAGTGRHGSTEDETLLVNFTARGPLVPGKTETLREGLDLGHRVSVDRFLAIFSESVKAQWKEKAKND